MEEFPIIDIHHFLNEESASKDGFLYAELNSPHNIDKPHQHFFFLLILF